MLGVSWQIGALMSDTEFVDELRRIPDAKCRLMSDMTSALTTTSDTESVAVTITEHTAAFREFSETVELPFMKCHSKRLQVLGDGAHLSEGQAGREHQESIFNAFICLLQRFKYAIPYTNDKAVIAAVTEFEHTTAQIPEPAEL